MNWKVINEGKKNAKVKGVIRPRTLGQMIKTIDLLLSAGYCTTTDLDDQGFKLFWGF